MRILKITKLCTGCGACANICPKHCISMVENKEGFLYPSVLQEKCVNCGLCEKVCPIFNALSTTNPTAVYAATYKEDSIREKSSSGGVFYALAHNIIQQGGVVFGAVFSKDFKVEHQAIDTQEEIEKLMRSKYVQSDINDQYRLVKKHLTQGRRVLFVGSPCQVAGLQMYLQKKYENLTTVDFICHGVPSPRVWHQYLQELEKERQSKVASINFRDKSKGWGLYTLKIVFENGEILREAATENLYIRAFLQNITLRNSCFNCKSKGCYQSDITIGDFWGIKDIHPELYSEKGVSLILVNSQKGGSFIEETPGLFLYPSSFENAIRCNPSWKWSSGKNWGRASFFKKLNKKSIKVNLQQAVSSPLLWRIQAKLHALKRK